MEEGGESALLVTIAQLQLLTRTHALLELILTLKD